MLQLGQIFIQKYKMNFDYNLLKDPAGNNNWLMTVNIESETREVTFNMVMAKLEENPAAFIFAAFFVVSLIKLY